MNASLLIFPVLVPLLFWGAYHYYHDRHRPEPVGNLLLSIALGVAASFLSKYLYVALGLSGPALMIAALFIVTIWLWRLNLMRRLADPN